MNHGESESQDPAELKARKAAEALRGNPERDHEASSPTSEAATASRPRPVGEPDRIGKHVAAVRRCFRRSAAAKAVILVGCGSLPVILLDVMLGVPSVLRWTAWGALAACGLFILVTRGWRPARRFDAAAGVRSIEHGNPDLGQLLRTASEVKAMPAPEAGGISPEFADALVDRASGRLDDLNLKKLVPSGTVRALLLGAAAVAAAFFLLYTIWPDFRTGFARFAWPANDISYTRVAITSDTTEFTEERHPRIVAELAGRLPSSASLMVEEPDGSWTAVPMAHVSGGSLFDVILTGRDKSFRYYVKAGDGNSEIAAMNFVAVPKLVKSSVEVDYPDYTGLETETFDSADVAAVEGTRAKLQFETTVPLDSGALEFADGTTIPLVIEGTLASAIHTLAPGETTYELTGRDAAGSEMDPVKFKLNGLPDKMPVVEIVEPKKEIEATAVAEVPVRIRVRDDFGVARVGVVLEARGEKKTLIEREFEGRDTRDISSLVAAAMEEFPLTIRDNVRVYAFAADHRERGGAESVSRLQAIDIKPFKRKWQMAVGGGGL